MKAVLAILAALALAGCAGSTVGYSAAVGYPYGYYDYGFRYGIYDHDHDIDVDIDRPIVRPDRPRPPIGVSPGRPTTLPARVPHGGRPGGHSGGGRLR